MYGVIKLISITQFGLDLEVHKALTYPQLHR